MVVIAMAVTHVSKAEGWLYVAAALDLFSRRVVGWSMKAERDASLVMDALITAVWRHGEADALLHHSDQGSQYTSEQFQHLLADNSVTCSTNRAGNVWDNSAMESFFSSLKTESTACKVYRAGDEARADMFDYIERFYNPSRRHSALGGKNPGIRSQGSPNEKSERHKYATGPMSDLPGFLPVLIDAIGAMDAPIATASVLSAAPLTTDAPPPPDQRMITITLANGTRLEISAALGLPALSCIIGALR